ncbi:DUF2612 domain-containing protein [Escherichia coli]|nr:DUF2612 domain-containing protein [Escherichia coli]
MALDLDTLGLSATVTAEGISAPDYQTILSTLISYFQQIYGSDAYLDPDSKDGQMVALVALAIHDANNTAISVYRSFSPSTALDDALTSNVKINGIARRAATNSTVDELIEGEAGTLITNGSVKDVNGIIWNLPAQVTIGIDGTVIATATCSVAGAVAAPAGSVNKINTPTRGWVSVTKPKFFAHVDLSTRPLSDVSDAMSRLIPDFDIDTAIGVQLDVVGEWVGRSRRVATPVTGIYFSWDTERVGWDQGIWQGPYDPNDGFIDLSDEIYRLMLKVKVAINNWDGQNDSLPSILDAALAGSGIRMTIVDNQDMSISIWILGDPSVSLSEIDRLILDSAVNKGPFIALPAGYVPSRYDINPIDQVNSELWWAIQNGYMTVKAAGVRVREIETVSNGYQFFGFDIENDYIAGFDRGSWGERF